jgi:nitrogen regulatory protein P-II 1
MTKIEAIIRPEKLSQLVKQIQEIGYPGMTVTEIVGHGRQQGIHPEWPAHLRVPFLPKIKLEIVVETRDTDAVVHCIMKIARTGRIGDGKIFISAVKDAIRIRTKEHGKKALSTLKSFRKTKKRHQSLPV